VIFDGLNDAYQGHIEIMYPGGLECLFTKTPVKIWDFFECMAHEMWEDDNTRETFSHPIPDPYMIHVMPLDESQFGGISYDHSHTSCAPVSYDWRYSFHHDVDICPLLGRPHRLEALAASNRKINL